MSTGVFVMVSGRDEIDLYLFSSGSGAELTRLSPAIFVMLIAGTGADAVKIGGDHVLGIGVGELLERPGRSKRTCSTAHLGVL